MSVLGGLRAVSEDAVTRLAVRISDLPRPVLAAIGAGDLIAEQVQELREVAAAVLDGPDHVSTRGPRPAGSAAPGTGADLADLVDRARRLVALFSAVAPTPARNGGAPASESYGRLAGAAYTALAVRGRRSWSRVRAGGGPGSVVDADPT